MWTDYEYLITSLESQESQLSDAEIAHIIEPILPSNQSTKTSCQIKKFDDSDDVNHKTQERLFRILISPGLKGTENKYLSCDICHFRTVNRANLLRHMNRWHMDRPLLAKKFCCDICGVRMSQSGNLKTHRLSHTGEKPFPCTFESCQRRFFSSSELTIHVRTHLGLKPYKCDQCTEAFVSKFFLSTHMKTKHSDHRPFTCAHCGKTFKFIAKHNKHLLTHTDMKNYRCDVCGKWFRQQYAFKVHMNTHADNRPYKCRLCDRGFHSTASRRCHEKSVHSEK